MKLEAWSPKTIGRQVVMLILLVATAWWGYRQYYPADGSSSASNAQTGAGTPGVGIAAGSLPTALRLEALEPVAAKPSADRNPFRFGAPPPPPAPPPRAISTAPPASTAPPPPAVPAGPPPIPLKFVGVLQLPSGKKIASLSDGRGMLLGAEGDVIDGRYRIVKIGVESIVMEYVNGTGRQTIPLRGTEP